MTGGEARMGAGMEERPDATFEALWKRVLDDWDDDRPHAALLEHAVRTAMLPELAGRYRALSADAKRGERAKKKMEAVVIAATHMLVSQKTPRTVGTHWALMAGALLLFAVMAAMLARALSSR
jgi:hypothetical protein